MRAFIEGFRHGRDRVYAGDVPPPFFAWPGRPQPDAAEPKESAQPVEPSAGDTAELADYAEQLQARVDELEAEREAGHAALFADVLRLDGVKIALLNGFHPDKHPRATEAQRKAFGDAMAKINAAYEILERDT
jgi:hypothetical protein